MHNDEYMNKILGGYMGKNIGGSLGGPVEGAMPPLSLTFYSNLDKLPLPNDDLDLQLLNLHALEQHGPNLTPDDLAGEWLAHVFFPYDEYGAALMNFRRGVKPPLSGWFSNPFSDCMGAPIRSEIWAMVAPGQPDIAAHYAYNDAVIDHAGGEGVYGEVLFAVMESAAFFESDKDALLDLGLSYIPKESRCYDAISIVREAYKNGKSFDEARDRMLEKHRNNNFTDAPQNIGITILGFLYGSDFEDALLKTVNCGYDADCTCATLGALLGILYGREALPEKWVAPVGDVIAVSPEVKGICAPKTMAELAERTRIAAQKVMLEWKRDFTFNGSARADIYVSTTEYTYHLPHGGICDFEVRADFKAGGPSIAKNGEKAVEFTLINHTDAELPLRMHLDYPDMIRADQNDIDLKFMPFEEKKRTVVFRHQGNLAHRYDICCRFSRLHDRRVWDTRSIEFTLVPKLRFLVESNGRCQTMDFDSNRVAPAGLEKADTYLFKTNMLIPTDRFVKLNIATEDPITVTLDGEVCLNLNKRTIYMPAYHRSASGKTLERDMKAGAHTLEIAVHTKADPYFVAVVSSGIESADIGAFYGYTDVLFDAE